MHVLSGMLEAPDWAPHGESVLHQLDRKKGTTDPRKFEGNEDPIIIIGLAKAVIIGTGIVCLIDALKNKLK